MTDFLWAYIPHPEKSKAIELARTLTKEKLIACANIIDQMTSIYEWKDEICEEVEVLIIMKTQKACFEALNSRVKELHPYDCPCIIGLSIEAGNQEYLDWIKTQTGP
ncbi:MAG: divalent-cation tolerance protein CutA [Bdellovibrionota bacterium]|nr:divalent-cation tolerance protein CutA [Bdellovibrionota bacterium]